MEQNTQQLIVNAILLVGLVWVFYSGFFGPTKEQKAQAKKEKLIKKLQDKKYQENIESVKKMKDANTKSRVQEF